MKNNKTLLIAGIVGVVALCVCVGVAALVTGISIGSIASKISSPEVSSIIVTQGVEVPAKPTVEKAIPTEPAVKKAQPTVTAVQGEVIAAIETESGDPTVQVEIPPTPTEAATPTQAPQPSATNTPEPTPFPTFPPDFPVAILGPGDKVADISPWGPGVMTIIAAQAQDNFAVTMLDENNKMMDLAVNVIIGHYTGIRPVNWNDAKAKYMQVEANQVGEWIINFTPIWDIPNKLAVPGDYSNAADDVIRLDGFSGGPAAFTHEGTRNFSVGAYDSDLKFLGYPVNEIGAYSGTVMLPSGTNYVVVEADGKWTMKIPGN